jgi:alpha-1,3-mannosyltransferase
MLSKRLHSVFMLRCFNDCFAAFFLWVTIFCFQRRYWTFGALAYTLGLGVKMSLLLTLPAVVIILFLGRGIKGCLKLVWLMAQVQFAIAIPFLTKNPRGYLGRAFELSRQFKYEWTVNWRMVPEEIFLSRGFAFALLAGHVTVLLLFILNRWLRPTDRSLMDMLPSLLRLKSPFTPQQEAIVSSRLTPDFIMHAMLSANVIGLLFARSLHYQFYAYLAWSTPYLVWRASPRISTVWGFFILQEYAWNVFPSTTLSSIIVVLTLYMAVGSAYFAPGEENRTVKAQGQTASTKSK